ncbi:MAG: outer membrane beta-barrel protein [Pseudomonadota bacterium]
MKIVEFYAGCSRPVRWTVTGLLVATLALGLAGPAAAEEAEQRIDGGFYGGIQGGYAVPDARFSLGGSGLGDLRADGFRAGVFGGWALRRGSLIGAVEVDGGVATGDGMLSAMGTSFRVEPEFTAGVSLLGGAVIEERGVLYLRAGYQALVVDAELAGTETRDALHGVRIGAGAAFAISEDVSLRTEYVYSFFRDKDYDAGPAQLRVEARQGVARIGVVFGF